jgi:GTP cyclohydrolase II
VKGMKLNSVLPMAKIDTKVRVPLLQGQIEAEIMTFSGLIDTSEHLALCFGSWKEQQAPLVRLHSECLTGDVFGSALCDCGMQLNECLNLFHKKGGVLLYLRQEGRGIGLYNKLAAYSLQKLGQDTYEANRALNFPDDLRNYDVASQMLRALNIESIKLQSNNPDKANQLERNGIKVLEILNTGLFINPHNVTYLRTKALKSQHSLNIEDIDNFINKIKS